MLERIDEEYGPSNYGRVRYNSEELYWIGYIYRYYSYTYNKSSLQAYKTVKPKELRQFYLPYHTMSPEQAIERILEAHNLIHNDEDELYRQYIILKRVREKGAGCKWYLRFYV